MRIGTVMVALVVGAVLVAGCGDDDSSGSSGPSSTTTTTRDGAQIVEPRSGMADVEPVAFESATPSGEGRVLSVRFTGGAPPCFVLDRVVAMIANIVTRGTSAS